MVKFFQYQDEKVPICAMYGGLAWPGEKPGFAVVVAQELHPPSGFQTEKRWFFQAEYEDWDKSRLIRQCVDFTMQYRMPYFFGRSDRQEDEVIRHWNRSIRDEGLPEFRLHSLGFSDGRILSLIDLIKSSLQNENKRLHNLQDFQIMKYLDETPLRYDEVTDRQLPAVAALGYALKGLLDYLPPDPERDARRRQEMERRRRYRCPATGY